MHNYHECSTCLTMFVEHHDQTAECNLCFSSLLTYRDIADAFVHEDDYALEVETDLTIQSIKTMKGYVNIFFSLFFLNYKVYYSIDQLESQEEKEIRYSLHFVLNYVIINFIKPKQEIER